MTITVPNISNYKFKITNGQSFFVSPKEKLYIKAFQINPVNIKNSDNRKLLNLISNYIKFFRSYIKDIKFISLHQDNGLKFYLLIYAKGTEDMIHNIRMLKDFSNSCLSLHSVDSLSFLSNIISAKKLNFKHRLINPNYYYDKSHYYTIITLKDIGKGLSAFWLANLVNYSNISLIMSVGTQNVAEIEPKVNRAISELESQVNGVGMSSINHLNADSKAIQLISSYDDIKNNSEILKKVNAQIIISALSLKDLDKCVKKFKGNFSHFRFSTVNRYADYDIKNLMLPIKHHLNLIESYDLGGSYMFTDLNNFNNSIQPKIKNFINPSFHFNRLFGQVIPLKENIRMCGSIYLSDTLIALIGIMAIIFGNGLFKGSSSTLPLIFDIPILIIIFAILLFKHRN